MRTTLAALFLLASTVALADEVRPGRVFSPLVRPDVPATTLPARNVIDAFVNAKLVATKLTPAPEADRRTLIRRLMIDLHGLPPLPEETAAFVADGRVDAYERLVDRLLASPRYGERWARHWLDVAHYADSHGQDQDRPRPNAWPYRDYVIRAFDEDRPYARFVREQIAGDVLYPDDPQAVAATGFLAAGPFDESSLVNIQADGIDRLIAQYLDRDDIVSSVFSTFAGLTVGCARCHDHKFDPVSQADYYSLQAVFAGIDKSDRAYDADPAVAKARRAMTSELAAIKANPADRKLLAADRRAEVAAFEAAHRAKASSWIVAVPRAAESKQGAALKILPDGSVLSGGTRPDRDTYAATLEPGAATVTGLRLETLCDDSLPHRGPGRQGNGNLHLSEIRVVVVPKAGEARPVRVARAVADFDQDGWGVARAIDGVASTAWGIYPKVGSPHAAVFAFAETLTLKVGDALRVELDQLHGEGHLIGRFRLSLTSAPSPALSETPLPAAVAAALSVPAEKRTEAQQLSLAAHVREAALTRSLAALPPQAKVYCGSRHFVGEGTFRPVAKPRPVHVLKRGDANFPGKLAAPGAVGAVTALPSRFALKDADDEGQRRAALAEWLTHRDNPLTWRVIANRVWHHHFGRGIIDTPNDLGNMGGKPSHPELLDRLACEVRDQGGSLKSLHRLIVTSAAYRRSSRHDDAAAATDGDNRLLWRMNRQRLDAETLRDGVARLAGTLDDTRGGPPVMHFVMKPALHVTPGADYDAFDVDSPGATRRSVYRYVFRTRPDPLLEALDCPESSQSAPTRSASVGPLQALAMWNNKFVLRQAEHLAARARREATGNEVGYIARRVLGREPRAPEATAFAEYARRHSAANLARVLFNASEFVFAE